MSSLAQREPGPGPVHLRVAVIALVTAGAALLLDSGDAFWLSLPGILVAGAASRTRLGAALSTAAVSGAALVPLIWLHVSRLPSPVLALLVPTASAAVLVAVRERLERECDALREFALNDSLTGVANRRSLLARIEYEITRHTRARHSFALVMLDLDGFKLINDRFGHAAGDDLLRDVAAALSRSMRAQDTVARLGGDEFCVLAPETDERGTHRLAARIAMAVDSVHAGLDPIRASTGIALFPNDGIAATALLHAADQRLLHAKRARRGDRPRRRAA